MIFFEYFKKLSTRKLQSLATICAGGALLVFAAIFVFGDVSIPSVVRLAFLNLQNQLVATPYWQGYVTNSGGYPTPNVAYVDSQPNGAAGTCPASYAGSAATKLIYGAASAYDVVTPANAIAASVKGDGTITTAGRGLTVVPGNQINIEWACQPSVTVYSYASIISCNWFGCNNRCDYYGASTVNPATNNMTLVGPGISSASASMIGSQLVTIPANTAPGTINYAVSCKLNNTATYTTNLPVTVIAPPTITAPSYVTLGNTGAISWAASTSYATSSCVLSGPTSAATSSPVYVTPKFVSTGATLPVGTTNASQITIGNTMYLFGGTIVSGNPGADTVSATIYSAPASSPNTWAAVGSLPVGLANSSIVRVGNTLYLLGGQVVAGATKNIYTASASSPTSWSLFGQTLVDPLYSSSLVASGNTLYLYGGIGAATTSVNSIYSAPDTTLVWTKSASTLPGPLSRAQAAIINGVIYLFGGNP